jgi:ribonuclease-3
MPEPEALTALEARLGVTFRDRTHLLRALRHRSVSVERPLDSNERMEFLGDSIVGMVVCEYLFATFPESSEGGLAKAKAFLVCEPTLAEAAAVTGMDVVVELNPAEEASGGRARPSILSDTFEAVIAAVFLDQGFRAARRVVRAALKDPMKRVSQGDYHRDFKSALQERTQAKNRKTPHYRITEERGEDHKKIFIAQALLNTKVLGAGEGRSKKEAEQAAARDALETMTRDA